ncbi:CENP-A multicopy suppressor protein 2 [Colletotrichum sidae]|uniref:CENP-A multicopy suppressor protein 2 n=1 Tax=Colletotrichum sidae TaxID=1347389 RepID=A0A4R8TT10_9PEZI|nr:CENP-A multicopy suppressor protein 2 [Colletotrichum sidae]
MASPMPLPHSPMGNWGGQNQQAQQQPQLQPQPQPQLQPQPQPPSPAANEIDELGIQVKTMGLKVTYTVADDGECFLARHPQLLPVQTLPIDERRTVGMVDLKICAQAVVRCSPELLSDVTRDFAVYAYDYSEPDEPLVGQGLLGWIVNNTNDKRIIGRATRNPLAVFSGGVKDILEIKFKLKPVAAMAQPRYQHESKPGFGQSFPHSDNAMNVDAQPVSKPGSRQSFHHAESPMAVDAQPSRPVDGSLTPSSHAEWNSFVQSNQQMRSQQYPPRVDSPRLPQNQTDIPQHSQNSETQSFNGAPQQYPPRVGSPRQFQNQPQHPAGVASPRIHQSQADLPQHMQRIEPRPYNESLQPPNLPAGNEQPMQNSEGPNRVAPTPVDTATDPQTNPPSRPSSRASTRPRKSKSTGRPRGRPRKQPRAESQGHTSGYEDGTDGDEGPAKKKRATMTQVTSNINAPFGGGPESLRVAASTAGSLRTMRPPGVSADVSMGSHMQEVPRAPTPVPEQGPRRLASKAAKSSTLRRQSTLSQAPTPPSQPIFSDAPFAMSPSQQDRRSPVDSEAATPMYSEDSPAPIGSSPPFPRTVGFVRSSPPASSPILPPMPKPQPDSGFMSGGVDDIFEDTAMTPLPMPVLAPAKSRANSRNVTKERRDRQGIPIQIFQLAPRSSDADFNRNIVQPTPSRPPIPTPSIEPSLRPPTKSISDPKAMMAPPPLQPAEKEPSPRSEEPVVAIKIDVDVDDQGAPNSVPQLPADNRQQTLNGLELGLEQLAQAVKHMPLDPILEPARPNDQASFVRPPAPPSLQRSGSSEFSLASPAIPASDPIGPLALPGVAGPDITSFSEAPSAPPKNNKNYVKKLAIKEKLAQAIANGQTPMYCANCGAIETPTWRKIWTQEHEGVPEFTEFSEKPGRITAIIVLDRDADEKPTKYQMVKKALGPQESKADWGEHMLCNPCGIWLSKWKSHRPSEKWEKDSTRLGQQRRSRGAGRAPRPSRSKKNANQVNPTSEAYMTTDPIGPEDQGLEESRSRGVSQVSNANELAEGLSFQQLGQRQSRSNSPGNVSNPGSSHSRGSGTANSPITIDHTETAEDMGQTRRLLFPSPRKEGVAKVLGELAVNIVQTAPDSTEAVQNKDSEKDSGKVDPPVHPDQNKENLAIPDDDLEELFRSPVAIARPSTPPPRDRAPNNGPFKTPTRPTPSHRPITRSVTRSVSRALRTGDFLRSPAAVRRTPTRTPRSAKNPIRRSPRLHNEEFSQMELDLEEFLQTQTNNAQYDSDMLEAMNRALAESMNTSGADFDLTDMVLDSSCQLEFGDLLGTPIRPSPRTRGQADYDDWENWENNMRVRHAADDARRA